MTPSSTGLNAVLVGSIALVASACSGDGGTSSEDDVALFEVERASELAHAMMLEEEDLPGSGWKLIGADVEDEDDAETDALFASLPECDDPSLRWLLEDDESRPEPPGWAQVEFERANREGDIAPSIDFEVTIRPTVQEIQEGWDLGEPAFESGQASRCFAAFWRAATQREIGEANAELTVDARDPSAQPPQDGEGLAFVMTVREAQGPTAQVALELYIWPYSNAGMFLAFIGESDDLPGGRSRTWSMPPTGRSGPLRTRIKSGALAVDRPSVSGPPAVDASLVGECLRLLTRAPRTGPRPSGAEPPSVAALCASAENAGT